MAPTHSPTRQPLWPRGGTRHCPRRRSICGGRAPICQRRRCLGSSPHEKERDRQKEVGGSSPASSHVAIAPCSSSYAHRTRWRRASSKKDGHHDVGRPLFSRLDNDLFGERRRQGRLHCARITPPPPLCGVAVGCMVSSLPLCYGDGGCGPLPKKTALPSDEERRGTRGGAGVLHPAPPRKRFNC